MKNKNRCPNRFSLLLATAWAFGAIDANAASAIQSPFITAAQKTANDAIIQACFRPTATSRCQNNKSGTGYSLPLNIDSGGSAVLNGVSNATVPAEGCYNAKFQRSPNDTTTYISGGKCVNKNYPLRVVLNWKTSCSVPPSAAVQNPADCIEGALILVRPQVITDIMTSTIANQTIPVAPEIPVSSKSAMDQAKEACENMSGSFFTWDATARICRKKAKYICEQELKMKWTGTSDTQGSCSAALAACSEVPVVSATPIPGQTTTPTEDLSSFCGNRDDYCKSYQYIPSGLPASKQCFCVGTSLTVNKAGKSCKGTTVASGGSPTPTNPTSTGTATSTTTTTSTATATPTGTGTSGFPTNILKVATGHACMIQDGGAVTCWGSNEDGALGLGAPNKGVPDPYHEYYFGVKGYYDVEGLSRVVSLNRGGNVAMTCAVTSDGKVVYWGYKNGGYHWGTMWSGGAWYNSSNLLKTQPSITNAVSCSISRMNMCVVLSDGTAKCWGNYYLGNNTSVENATPVTVLKQDLTPLTGIREIVGNEFHNCALTDTGDVYCWGFFADWSNNHRKIGTETETPGEDLTARKLTTVSNVTDMSTEYSTMCFTQSDGTYKCYDWRGRYNFNKTPTDPATWTDVTAVQPVMDGDSDFCYLKNKRVYCKSQNGAGNTKLSGKGGTYVSWPNTSHPADNLTDITTLRGGHIGACAYEASTCKVYCWGGSYGACTTYWNGNPISDNSNHWGVATQTDPMCVLATSSYNSGDPGTFLMSGVSGCPNVTAKKGYMMIYWDDNMTVENDPSGYGVVSLWPGGSTSNPPNYASPEYVSNTDNGGVQSSETKSNMQNLPIPGNISVGVYHIANQPASAISNLNISIVTSTSSSTNFNLPYNNYVLKDVPLTNDSRIAVFHVKKGTTPAATTALAAGKVRVYIAGGGGNGSNYRVTDADLDSDGSNLDAGQIVGTLEGCTGIPAGNCNGKRGGLFADIAQKATRNLRVTFPGCSGQVRKMALISNTYIQSTKTGEKVIRIEDCGRQEGIVFRDVPMGATDPIIILERRY